MIEMRWAKPNEKSEIVDFCDFVFSKYHHPHDFETLLPKLYGEKGDSIPHHFIIREDGRIAAAILAYPVEMHIGQSTFMTIGVGSVSVHPRAQGRGYMKHMLAAVDEHAKEYDALFAVLGGQRQRYGYFGYVPAGYHMECQVTRNNAKHALKGTEDGNIDIVPMTQVHVEKALSIHRAQFACCKRTEGNFLDVAASWYCKSDAVLKDGEMVGFAISKAESDCTDVREIQLLHESDLPAVIKKLISLRGPLKLAAAPWQTQRASYLGSICETIRISKDHMYKVYQEKRLRAIFRDAGLCADAPVAFESFDLPLPLFVSSPDTV